MNLGGRNILEESLNTGQIRVLKKQVSEERKLSAYQFKVSNWRRVPINILTPHSIYTLSLLSQRLPSIDFSLSSRTVSVLFPRFHPLFVTESFERSERMNFLIIKLLKITG